MDPSPTDQKPHDAAQGTPRSLILWAVGCSALALVPFLSVIVANWKQEAGFFVFFGFFALAILWPHGLMLGLLLLKPGKTAVGLAVQVGGAHFVLGIAYFLLMSVILMAESGDFAELWALALLFVLISLWSFGHGVLCRRAGQVYDERWPDQKEARTHRSGTIGLVAYLILFVVFAAATVPSTMRNRVGANETSAVASLRTLNTVAEQYRDEYQNGYPKSLALLGPVESGQAANCNQADLIDRVLASGNKNGYVFEYRPGATVDKPVTSCPPGVTSYVVTARPAKFGESGVRSFYTDETKAIRFTPEERAPTRADRRIDE